MNVFEGFIAEWKSLTSPPSPKGICFIAGTARTVETSDYSVSVSAGGEIAVRVCLSDQQAKDLALRLQTLKDLGKINDWSIIASTDLSLSELLGWIISMGDDSESLEEL